MYLRLHCLKHFSRRFVLASALALAAALAAEAQTPQPAQPGVQLTAPAAQSAPPAATATLRGHISDPSGALIPGTEVKVSTAAGTPVQSITADAAGGYQVRGLPAGSYIVQADSPGFASFVSTPISLNPGQTRIVDVKMAIEAAQQQVEVTEEGNPQVSVEAGDNASAIVIKGKDLDALSDDPDELSSELQALAGPAAGPNGGQIYIDGFTAGELPPKSAIREIRINQNPFSAEFDKLGYGRIEILTKPGTDTLHGRGFVQGNDDTFNSGNPFTASLPSYHSIQYNGTVSGPINKAASYFFSVEQRNNQNDSVYSASTALQDPVTGAWYVPTGSAGQVIPVSGSLFNPATHTNISPRIDLQLGQKNTLTLRYQFFRNHVVNSFGDSGFGFGGSGGSSVSLPSVATDSDTIEHSFQLEDSQVISDRMVNETRFQYLRDLSTVTPLSSAPNVSVPGDFVSGGSTSQTERDHTDHYELQDLITMTAGAHALKFGTRLRDNRDANTTNTYFNGSFNFSTLQDFVGAMDAASGVACPAAPPSGAENTACGTTNAPNKLTYYLGNENALGNVFDAALFFQDDWKKTKNLTLSYGVRWETQNHIADHDDWGPRVAFAYALDGHGKGATPKTVLRGGYGFFFDRLSIGTLMSAIRYNGKPGSQQQVVVNNPDCFTATQRAGALTIPQGSDCNAESSLPQIDVIAGHYHSPAHEQLGLSLERQLTRSSTFTATYLHTLGVHQEATIDANAFLPGTYVYGDPSTGVRPHPGLGIIDETFPEAIYKQNQFIVSVNARFSRRLSLTGYYNLNVANADTGTASNSYNLAQDYGRAAFVSRSQVFLMGSYTGPWGLTFNPFLIAQSGKPFDIATADDFTGDNFIGQDRPTLATNNPLDEVVNTSYGSFNVNPQPGETVIPANLGNGPAAVAVNLRVTRGFGIGPRVEGSGSSGSPSGGGSDGGGGHRGGGGGFGGFGGPFGAPGGGGSRGGPFGGIANSGRKYTLTLSAQALNLFNDIDLGTPDGTVTPSANGIDSRFGKSTSLAGGIFSSGSAARRIFVQAAFQF